MKNITVVIATKNISDIGNTLYSLQNQSLGNPKIVVIEDKQRRGANWARNEGFKQVKTNYVLFSDDDIFWEEDAIQNLYLTLLKTPKASYCYGCYEMDDKIYCNQEFDLAKLKKENYISTMSLIKSSDFVGFDENLKRFQDWDLWLNMWINHHRIGVYCGKQIFSTCVRPGISFGGEMSKEEGERIIKEKWKL